MNETDTDKKRREWELKDPHFGNDIGSMAQIYIGLNAYLDHHFFGKKSTNGSRPYAQPRPNALRGKPEKGAELFRREVLKESLRQGISSEDRDATIEMIMNRETNGLTKDFMEQGFKVNDVSGLPVYAYEQDTIDWIKQNGRRRIYSINHDLDLIESGHWLAGYTPVLFKVGPARKPFPAGTRFKILLRDGFKCVYCGTQSTKDELDVFHIDHVISVKDGGSNDEDNLVTACIPCNLGKGSKSIKLRTERINP